ncbi:hypothetical protein [Dankookia rubra]|uniref:hypothetical protein n=1 Tax=Dankookia rubra TaxID=1442381 RepID=UPI00140C78CD|nr:hypothetical protein [Dankookia rubra]
MVTTVQTESPMPSAISSAARLGAGVLTGTGTVRCSSQPVPTSSPTRTGGGTRTPGP